jgi:hypothetical protein
MSVKEISDIGFMAVAAGTLIWMTRKMFSFIMQFKELVDKVLEILHKIREAVLFVKEATSSDVMPRIRAFANYAFEYNLYQALIIIGNIKEANNLQDREAVEAKLRSEIEFLFQMRNTDFDYYSFKGRPLSEYCNPNWVEELFALCMKCIYDGKPYHRDNYTRTLKIFYEKVKHEFIDNLTEG